MTYDTLKLEFENQIATLTFDRPEKRNALSPEMIRELMEAFDELERGPARVIILTGAGKAFCAGMDLASLHEMAVALDVNPTPGTTPGTLKDGATPGGRQGAAEEALQNSRTIARLFRRIYEFPKPLVAAVNGAAIAGGCGIATLCDFTVAAPEAKFGYTEVKIGFLPAIVSVFLIRQVGEKVARDLLLTGRIFDAREAYELGLVSEVTKSEGLLEYARALAVSLLEASPTSLASTKRLLGELARPELDRELDLAIEANARIRLSADFREGLASFLEKRKPNWRGE